MYRISWFVRKPSRLLLAVVLFAAVMQLVQLGVFAQEPSADPPITELFIGEWHIIQDTTGNWVWVWGDEPAVSVSETISIPEKQFSAQGLSWSPNCGMAQVKGYIYDSAGNPVNGIRVRLWSDEWEGAISLVSGVGITYGPGEWDISLQRGQTGRFYLAVWDWQTGPNSYVPVDSEIVELDFDYTVENCEPGGGGQQVAEVNFIRNY